MNKYKYHLRMKQGGGITYVFIEAPTSSIADAMAQGQYGMMFEDIYRVAW